MIRCGKCKASHTSIDAVRACYTGALFSCHWMVERYIGWVDEETGEGEGENQIVDCGAEAIGTERGWTCAAGHEHVTIEAQHNEGWAYAADAGEAILLARAGVEPRTMDGRIATSPDNFVA